MSIAVFILEHGSVSAISILLILDLQMQVSYS